jgi:hypothetical protein
MSALVSAFVPGGNIQEQGHPAHPFKRPKMRRVRDGVPLLLHEGCETGGLSSIRANSKAANEHVQSAGFVCVKTRANPKGQRLGK